MSVRVRVMTADGHAVWNQDVMLDGTPIRINFGPGELFVGSLTFLVDPPVTDQLAYVKELEDQLQAVRDAAGCSPDEEY